MLPYDPRRPYLQKRKIGEIDYLAVHYDEITLPERGLPQESDLPRMVGIARYHMAKNWVAPRQKPAYGHGFMYAYYVTPSAVYQTRPEDDVTWSVCDGNRKTLSICCSLGKGQEPPARLLTNLRGLLLWLCYQRPDFPAGRSDVYGHGELGRIYGGGPDFGNNTVCPGGLLEWVRLFRAHKI